MESLATVLPSRGDLETHLDREREIWEDIEYLRKWSLPDWKPRMTELMRRESARIAAGGQFYVDTRSPFNTAALPAVTLATTAKQLWPTVTMSPTSPSDWYIGKEFRQRAYGTITTATTPGNGTVSIGYGTADNTGLLASSAAQTLVASQTNIPFEIDAYVECRGVGTSGGSPGGSLFAWARCFFGTAVIAVGSFLVPASAPAAVNADTTVNSGINIQFARSGSTAETMTVQDMIFWALN
jgi:hypothetical protein